MASGPEKNLNHQRPQLPWGLGATTSKERVMKRFRGWLLIVALAAASQAMAAGLITKKQAEQHALKAVGGGTVILAVLDTTPKDKRIWSVDIAGAAHEY